MQHHGQSFRLRRSSSCFHPALCAARDLRHIVIICGRARGRRLFGRHAIRREVSWSMRCRAARRRRHGVWLAFCLAGVADRRRQSAVAGRRLDRELHLRRRHRRSAARPVPPSDRPFAELFSRPPARHADQPHHRDVERGLHGREHVRLERAAALRRHGRGDRARHAPSARRWPPCWRSIAGIMVVVDVPPRRGRAAAASRFRRQGRRGRRRDGRRHQQHAAGAGVRRPLPRARAASTRPSIAK